MLWNFGHCCEWGLFCIVYYGSPWHKNDTKTRYFLRLSVKARTEPNQTEPAEITEPAQPNLRKLTDNYDYRYRVLAPLPIRTLVLLTSSSLIIIIIRSVIITLK